jgi:hypothetical protein
MMSRAAHTLLAGRVFETPDLGNIVKALACAMLIIN